MPVASCYHGQHQDRWSALGQQPAFAAGYGESVLTPPLGVELCGYGYYLERRAESVLDELKAVATQ